MGLNPTTAARRRSQLSSTARNAERSCDLLDLGRNEDANDIILGQAARNLMAHAGGKIDERFRNQVSNAYPRRLKTKLPSTGNSIRARRSAAAGVIDDVLFRRGNYKDRSTAHSDQGDVLTSVCRRTFHEC